MHFLKTKSASWRNQLKTKAGFLLTELLVAIAILSALMLAVSSFTGNIFSLQSYTSDELKTTDELRRVLKQFVAELRSAEKSDDGAYPIESATLTSIIFYTDIDGDGAREKVRYYIDGDSMVRGVTKSIGSPKTYMGSSESLTTLIHYITNPSSIFSYYPATYTGSSAALSVPAQINLIRLVSVRVTTDQNPNKAPGPVTESTQVSIRNLKDNL